MGRSDIWDKVRICLVNFFVSTQGLCTALECASVWGLERKTSVRRGPLGLHLHRQRMQRYPGPGTSADNLNGIMSQMEVFCLASAGMTNGY